MTVPPEDLSTRPPDKPGPLTPSWPLVAVMAIIAAVLIAVVVVTKSAEAIGIVVPSLLLLLGWLGSRRE